MPSQSYLQRQANKAAMNGLSRVSEINQALEPQVNEVIVQKPTASAVVNGVERNTPSPGKNVNSAPISAANPITVELKTSIIGTLLGNAYKIDVKNDLLTNITVPKNAQEMVKLGKIKPNGGNDTLTSFTKESLMYPLRFLDPSTLARYKRGYESADAEVILPGETRTWYIPILSDPFAINGVFMQGIVNVLNYELEFNEAAWIDGLPNLTGCSIISRHLYYAPDTMESLRRQSLISNKIYNFRSYVVYNPTDILIAGEEISVNLTTFKQKASEMFLQLFQNGQHLEDLGNYIESYGISIGETTLLGTVNTTYDDVILSAAHSYEPVIGATTDPWVVVSLSPEMATDYQTGRVHGHHHFDGTETLTINIKSTLPDTNYSLRIYFGKLDKMRSVGGVFTAVN